MLTKIMMKWNILATLVMTFAFCACSESNTAGTDEQSEGIVAIKDREIAGVSQKGPFLVGSSVAIQELDGHTLMQTGNSFRASIKNDQGDFVVKKRESCFAVCFARSQWLLSQRSLW